MYIQKIYNSHNGKTDVLCMGIKIIDKLKYKKKHNNQMKKLDSCYIFCIYEILHVFMRER